MSFAKTEKKEMEKHSLIKACDFWARGRDHCQKDSMGEDSQMQDAPEMELREILERFWRKSGGKKILSLLYIYYI